MAIACRSLQQRAVDSTNGEKMNPGVFRCGERSTSVPPILRSGSDSEPGGGRSGCQFLGAIGRLRTLTWWKSRRLLVPSIAASKVRILPIQASASCLQWLPSPIAGRLNPTKPWPPVVLDESTIRTIPRSSHSRRWSLAINGLAAYTRIGESVIKDNTESLRINYVSHA